MDSIRLILCSLFGLYGVVIGSFVNVLILRLPIRESITLKRSHCMSCGHVLSWYELFPLFSYLFLRGRCRHCKAHISIQYPIVEGLNGILYVGIFLVYGLSVETILYCLSVSALLALSVIDWRTQEIPLGFNIFILILGLIRLVTDYRNWSQYVIGLFAVSGFLLLLWLVTKGRGIGDGDIKLMAATGLLLGWQLNIVAFLLGCIIGSVVHLTRMAIKKVSHVLSFGPYLSMGVYIAMIWGEQLVSWYLN
ncbi:MAG: prepilin peptidase [Eubacteriales bacterium]|nr:prepilin peptidase [Lachnospiraceae bacterium]MDO5127483.1 prepilin peptidase [Eubacteriales bacterium]